MLLIGERIKELRMEKNMSQVRLGVELSVSQEAVSSYETNKTVPTLEVLVMIAKIFGVSVDYILGIDTVKKRYYESELDSFEASLIAHYKKLSDRDKELLIRFLATINEYDERRGGK